MLFVNETVKREELNTIQDFFAEYDNEIKTVTEEEAEVETCVSKYITSLVSGCYQKSVEDIENTTVGNKLVRRRNLSQIMQESFYHGANRFGNNFIA
ncbi:MAG: hypothetical protein MJ230_04510 [bacterium]|nr:hypothetical protein [bacterium]